MHLKHTKPQRANRAHKGCECNSSTQNVCVYTLLDAHNCACPASVGIKSVDTSSVLGPHVSRQAHKVRACKSRARSVRVLIRRTKHTLGARSARAHQALKVHMERATFVGEHPAHELFACTSSVCSARAHQTHEVWMVASSARSVRMHNKLAHEGARAHHAYGVCAHVKGTKCPRTYRAHEVQVHIWCTERASAHQWHLVCTCTLRASSARVYISTLNTRAYQALEACVDITCTKCARLIKHVERARGHLSP